MKAEHQIIQQQVDEFATRWEQGPHPRKTKRSDPAYRLLFDGHESTPVVYSPTCYICRDPEFAQMGLPLCRKCPQCGGHVPADDDICDDCGFCDSEPPLEGEYEQLD